MFQRLNSGDGSQTLVAAEENKALTMLVGRGHESLLQTLQKIGEEDFRATFLVMSPNVFAQGQEQRWFGNDPADVLALLNFNPPQRTAARRFHADVDPFDLGQIVLNLEEEDK